MSNHYHAIPRVRSSGRAVLAVLLVNLVHVGCLFDRNPVDGETHRIEHSASRPDIQPVIDSVSAKVEQIRQLTFLRPVYGRALTNDEWTAMVSGLFDTSWQSDFAHDYATELYQLGYTDKRDFDVAEAYGQLYQQNVAGFYAPGGDSLYVIGYDPGGGPQHVDYLHFVVSHELTHALQEQHFDIFSDDIASDIHESKAQSDFYQALQHAYEGDAELSGLLFFYKFLRYVSAHVDSTLQFVGTRRSEFLDVASLVADTTLISDPFFINYTTFSPYLIGPGYAGELYSSGGRTWVEIDNLYSGRQLTMAQIVTGQKVEMRSFPAAALRTILGASNTDYRDDDNMGALMLIALLAERLTAAAAEAALGWKGDLLLYNKESGDSLGAMVWAFSFATENWAEKFFGLLDEHVQARFGGEAPVYDSAGREWLSDSLYLMATYTSPDIRTWLVRCENEVYWLENVDAKKDTLISALIESRSLQLAKARAHRPGTRRKITHTPRRILSSVLLAPRLKQAEALLARSRRYRPSSVSSP